MYFLIKMVRYQLNGPETVDPKYSWRSPLKIDITGYWLHRFVLDCVETRQKKVYILDGKTERKQVIVKCSAANNWSELRLQQFEMEMTKRGVPTRHN